MNRRCRRMFLAPRSCRRGASLSLRMRDGACAGSPGEARTHSTVRGRGVFRMIASGRRHFRGSLSYSPSGRVRRIRGPRFRTRRLHLLPRLIFHRIADLVASLDLSFHPLDVLITVSVSKRSIATHRPSGETLPPHHTIAPSSCLSSYHQNNPGLTLGLRADWLPSSRGDPAVIFVPGSRAHHPGRRWTALKLIVDVAA